MWAESLAANPGLTKTMEIKSMKYLMLILMVFAFSFSVNALQVKDDYPPIDYGDTIEVQDFALTGELEKVPIPNTSEVLVNKMTASLQGDNGYKNTAENHGDSLPYEVGWQSTKTI